MFTKVVTVPVADMRREPDHRAERVSQALYGHVVAVKSSDENFDLIQTSDGYEGWVGQSFLDSIDEETPAASFVSTRWALFGLDDGGELVLPFGARVESDGELFWDCRSGRRMILAVGSVDDSGGIQQLEPAQVALTLLSAPYLWGGTSPYGYDCSGFVQAVFRRCGVELPRDSRDQCNVGESVTLQDSQPDDLIFFPGHVAIHLGDLRIIHATRLRGMVVVESLDPNKTDCRRDLCEKIGVVRRVMK
jgi:gamma-D-glutamyl-L-lysine dipeptidyl-peptidase